MTAADYNIKYKATPSRNLLKGSVKVKVIFAFLFLVSSLVFTQLVFANSLATDGQKLSQVQQEIRKLEGENTTLKAEIAENSSLTTLSEKAGDLGFKKPAKLTILN